MVGKLILAVVSEIIDTKNGNNDYKVLVFESTVSENDNEVAIGIIKVPANIINIMPIIFFIIR